MEGTAQAKAWQADNRLGSELLGCRMEVVCRKRLVVSQGWAPQALGLSL